ncbi:MAG: hypothetical protein AAGC76_00675 [Luteibacter sp.]|jgi:hypothetical protein|uniref:hypothetical protein n=1 Tax=Rhodanobacteraceae TaxID=1775411 RepID=UPI00055ADEBF|nr:MULTISPECIES: hypothetical protein [Rhodanobacteraceae]MDQ7994343.1 hypothetical protein [Luteibacter sp.]MDQ8048644.1 hypothetical protein [Luteibacter sp.]SDG12990.1 hypothetical protein SAMN04515659_2195 [Dyella sp. 333MFSha]SKB85515.1 hypothetical protein SAMN05660880_02929 [Luteibacter sp. 22Crub2.1]
MQHELLILRTLLVASLLVCGLIVGNMLTYTGAPIQLAATSQMNPVATTACVSGEDAAACPPPAA